MEKKKTLQIYSSFEEAKQAEYQMLATLTPQQHLGNTMALIKRIYGYTAAPPAQRKMTYIGYAEYFYK